MIDTKLFKAQLSFLILFTNRQLLSDARSVCEWFKYVFGFNETTCQLKYEFTILHAFVVQNFWKTLCLILQENIQCILILLTEMFLSRIMP